MDSWWQVALVAGLLFVSGLGACREGPRLASRVAGYSAPVDTVVLLDSDLKRPLSVEEHSARRTETGSLEVLVVVRNRSDAPLAIELRTSHFDGALHRLDDVSEWQPIRLLPRSEESYSELSLSPSAEHYYVEVRHAQRL